MAAVSNREVSRQMTDGTEQVKSVEQPFPRELGVGDIDSQELEQMCHTIRHVVQRDCDVSVQDIYVMGSFARGEAMRAASDLDIRILVTGVVEEATKQECEHDLKCEYGPDIRPSVCGYLDPHITVLSPCPDDAHVRIDCSLQTESEGET